MTDETTAVAESAYMRCRSCGIRYPNTQIDRNYHKLNCPHDIQLRLAAAVDRIEKLEAAAEVRPDVVTLNPMVDDVPWDDEVQAPAPDEEETIIPNPIVRQYVDEDDEEDETAPVR